MGSVVNAGVPQVHNLCYEEPVLRQPARLLVERVEHEPDHVARDLVVILDAVSAAPRLEQRTVRDAECHQFAVQPRGAVVHVITPRESDGEKPAVGIKWPEPHGAVWLRVAAMARRIRRLNHDAAQLAAKKPERIAESRRFLHGEKPAASVEVAALERLSSLYAVADAWAIQRQTEVRIGWKWLLC